MGELSPRNYPSSNIKLTRLQEQQDRYGLVAEGLPSRGRARVAAYPLNGTEDIQKLAILNSAHGVSGDELALFPCIFEILREIARLALRRRFGWGNTSAC
jgi:hypothetical protein